MMFFIEILTPFTIFILLWIGYLHESRPHFSWDDVLSSKPNVRGFKLSRCRKIFKNVKLLSISSSGWT